MKCKQISFTKPNTAELVDMDVKKPDDNEVLVETIISSISNGTERANLSGNANVHFYADAEVVFPRLCGYSSVGFVREIGKNVKSVNVGDRVVVYWGPHKHFNTVNEEQVVKVYDDSISDGTCALSFISTFPMAAIRKTRIEIGESALVMGLGPLGTIAVKLLRIAGAVPIIAVDPNEKRREDAIKYGADYAFDPFSKTFVEDVKKVTNGGVNVAIEVTGVGAGFNEALDCMAKFGRVALLGCTRNSDFTVDYYRKIHGPGITVIGAHTLARPSEESHPGWYTHRDDIKAILKLCGGKRLNLEEIIKEVHSPNECPEVYDRLVNDKDFPISVQFDWRNI